MAMALSRGRWIVFHDTNTTIELGVMHTEECDCPINTKSTGVIVMDSLLLVVAFATVLVNTAFILTIWKNRPLHTYTNKLLLSNAVIDLFVGCFVMPFHVMKNIQGGCWQFGTIGCEISQSLDVHLTTASIFHFTGVAAERYLRIVKTFWYERWIKRLIPAIIIFWLLPTPFTFAAIFSGFHQQGSFTREVNWSVESPDGQSTLYTSQMRNECGKQNPLERHCRCSLWASKEFTFASTLFPFVLPILVMIYFYFRIFAVAYRHAKNIDMMRMSVINSNLNLSRSSVGDSSWERRRSSPTPTGATVMRRASSRHSLLMSKDIRVVRLCALVFVCFIVCWAPYFIMTFLEAYCVGPNYQTDQELFDPTPEQNARATGLELGFYITIWLGCFNSLLNPILMFMMEKNYRNGFRILMHRKLPYISKIFHLSNPRNRAPTLRDRSSSAMVESPPASSSSGTNGGGNFFDRRVSETTLT